MTEIHCHTCGGSIADPTIGSHRVPDNTIVATTPHAGLCACELPIIYGPPAGYLSWPAIQRPIIPRPRK